MPDRCFGCNALLYRGERTLCAFCRHELPLTEYTFGLENAVDRKLYGRVAFQKASALLRYEEGGLAQKLIFQLKYGGQQQVGDFLGKWYGPLLARDPFLPAVDWVFPVPLHPSRKRRRGYNQCTLFGKAVARCLGSRFSEKHLIRRRLSRSQTQKSRENRSESMPGAFTTRHTRDLTGSRILIVDDVVTTGATLEACCRALKKAAPELQIYLASLAVVP